MSAYMANTIVKLVGGKINEAIGSSIPRFIVVQRLIYVVAVLVIKSEKENSDIQFASLELF